MAQIQHMVPVRSSVVNVIVSLSPIGCFVNAVTECSEEAHMTEMQSQNTIHCIVQRKE
jgi:hypothetical protein